MAKMKETSKRSHLSAAITSKMREDLEIIAEKLHVSLGVIVRNALQKYITENRDQQELFD